MNVCNWGKRLALTFGVLFLLPPSPCRADLLPVTFQSGAPIVSGSNGSLSYNASTGDFHLTLTGPSLTYAAPFVLPRGFALLSSGSLTIDLIVDQTGNFVANGTGLTLTGSVTINGAAFSGTLLTGTITNFGSDPAGPPSHNFDGYYTITGGSLTTTKTGTGGAQVFGGYPIGAAGGFLLDAENVTGGTLGNFSQNFSSSSVKPSVGVLAPEPRTLVLSLIGTALLVWWTRPQLFRQLVTWLSQPRALSPLLSGAFMRGIRATNVGRSGLPA